MTAPEQPDALGVLAGVAAWARPFLIGPAPEFGSATWLALPLDDRTRTVAVVRAALAHYRAGDPLPDLEQRARAALDVASSHAVAEGEHWSSWAYRPRPAELAALRDWQARAEAAA